MLGGAVAGARVRADWPGLAPGRLFENRDVAPTTDVRSVIKGILLEHLSFPAAQLGKVLPGSNQATPLSGLIRT
jgi:uncharacterized protein (DUF1501 family)